MDLCRKEYDKIVELRNHHLKKAKEVSEIGGVEEATTYSFAVAHGLTEAIRVLSGVQPVTILKEDNDND